MSEPGTTRPGGAPGGAASSPSAFDALGPLDSPDDAADAVDAPDVDPTAGAVPAAVVDVRVALPMPTWTRILAAVVGLAAAVAGTVAVFRTDNGVGSAGLLLVAVFLTITAVDGQFPRLKIGDNEVMSNLTRAYRETKGKAERATARAADAQGNSEDVMDGLADAQARIAHLERLAGVDHGRPTVATSDQGRVPDRPVGATPEPAGRTTGGPPPDGASDVSFDLDLRAEEPRADEEQRAHEGPRVDGGPRTDDRPATTLAPAVLDLAEQYRSLRWTMPSGPARTRAMTGVVDEMRRGSADVDPAPLLGSDDIGLRLLAAAALYERPRPEAVPALIQQVMTDRKPFNEYWSLLALRRALRGRCDLLTDDVRDWLERRVGRVSYDASRANLIRQILRDCP